MSVASAAVSGLSVAAGPALLVGFAGGAGRWMDLGRFVLEIPRFMGLYMVYIYGLYMIYDLYSLMISPETNPWKNTQSDDDIFVRLLKA